MLLKDLVDRFNIAANTAFNKGYSELDPRLKNLVYEFMSGDVKSTDFPITKIMSKIRAFTGDRKHFSPADAFYTTVTNFEFDGAVDIPRRDLKRAQKSNSLTGLDLYVKEIESLGSEAKDFPYEEILDMIEAGDASTYGTTFDGQNMFDTTHAFDNVAGTQSNLLTGTGTTAAQITADLKSALTAFRGFYYTMDAEGTDNKKKRHLNKSIQLDVVVPDALVETFEDINKAEYIASGVTNTLRGKIRNIIPRPMSDTNDWYAFEVSESNVKPFIISMEEVPKIEMPMSADENLKEHKMLTWGLEGFSFGKAYGAWWKGIMVTNT